MVVQSFYESIVAETLPTKDYVKIKSMDSWSGIDGDVKLTILFALNISNSLPSLCLIDRISETWFTSQELTSYEYFDTTCS